MNPAIPNAPVVSWDSPLLQGLSDFGTSIAGIVNAFIGIGGLILGGLTVYALFRIAKFLTRNIAVTITYQNSSARRK